MRFRPCAVWDRDYSECVAGGTGQKATNTQMKNLSNLSAPTLHLLKKLVTDECKVRREDLGQTKGEFEVDETVVLHTKGVVKVSKSTPDAIIAQKAKPWALFTALLEEANSKLEAAGKVGIDLAKVVEMAEKIDPDLAKKAKAAADAEVSKIKEEVRDFKWGSVRPAGEAALLAHGDNLAEDEEPATASVPF